MLPRDPALDTDRKIAERFERLERMIQSLRTEPLGQNDAWITPTMLSSWSDYGFGNATCQYMKDALGFVHVKGLIKNGSPVVSSIFVLPAGYRPLEAFGVATVSASGLTRIVVGPDGTVVVFSGGSATWTDIFLPAFLAEQ